MLPEEENTNVIVAWAWMRWSLEAIGTRAVLWFGHGRTGDRMLWEHEHYYGLGMDEPVIGCTRETNERYYGLGMDAPVIRFSSVLSGEGGKP